MIATTPPTSASEPRLKCVSLDEFSIGRGPPDLEQERAMAIYDLLEENSFALPGHAGGPYDLKLSISDRRLVFDISDVDGPAITHVLSLSPFRKLVKDYWLVCESYYKAVRNASVEQIQTLDMARRGLHNEGSTLLIERLEGKILIDFNTARRLFTLISVLHWKG